MVDKETSSWHIWNHRLHHKLVPTLDRVTSTYTYNLSFNRGKFTFENLGDFVLKILLFLFSKNLIFVIVSVSTKTHDFKHVIEHAEKDFKNVSSRSELVFGTINKVIDVKCMKLY